jgi:hypothetical protein
VRVGIKYCGGCNPWYDRPAIVRRLQDDFPQAEVVRAGDAEVDAVAVVCGCPVACACHADLQGAMGKVIVTQESDYEALRRLLSSLKAMEEKADGLES